MCSTHILEETHINFERARIAERSRIHIEGADLAFSTVEYFEAA